MLTRTPVFGSALTAALTVLAITPLESASAMTHTQDVSARKFDLKCTLTPTYRTTIE